MAKGLKITLKMRPKRPERKFKKVPKDLQREFIRQIRKLEQDALKIVKRNTPVRTGRLRDSFRSNRTVRKSPLFGLVEVFSNLIYARFIDEGTGPSVGRYVPQIDRRLSISRIGTHPGVRATNYLGKSEQQVFALANKIPKRLQFSVAVSLSRNFRGR